jgi:hypothetical protein
VKIHRDWKPLVRELRDAGYEVRPGGRHYAIYRISDGQKVNQLPCTSSDRRALKNKRADLRRLGFLARA